MQLTPLKHVSETELSMAPFYKAWLRDPTKFQEAYDPPIRQNTKKGSGPILHLQYKNFSEIPHTNPRTFPLVISKAFLWLFAGAIINVPLFKGGSF